jgi:UTP--glucose-1-phosphate uridylyltransferase
MTKVTKAVIAAAGFGTRFLPQTKAMPKEMLPLVDKPIIQYIVEDLVEAGIKDIIIVGSSNKRSIEDHFDMPSQDLLANLISGGKSKQHFIDELEAIANLANFIYIRQKGPYGNATPILNAAHLLGNEPFIYAFADDLTVAKPNCFKQMIKFYDELGGGILPCIKVSSDEEYRKYGILGGQQIRDDVIKMDSIIEKPGKIDAPSDFASVGGYLLPPSVHKYLDDGLRNLPPGKEFYATDSIIQPMILDGKDFYGCEIANSRRYDTGDKMEYVKTVVDFALEREDMRDELLAFLKSKVQ